MSTVHSATARLLEQPSRQVHAPSFAAAAAVDRSGLGFWLVVFAAIFNVGLCFIETRGWMKISNLVVAIVELAIMGLGVLAIRRSVMPRTALLLALCVAFVIGMKLVNPDLSVKILHDFGIMYIFYKLGLSASPGQALRLVRLLMAVVLALGFFELLFTDAFERTFDVWSYYVDKGVIAQTTVNYSGTNLFLSGDRGALSRTFFPSLLGSHRVSSIFLEPVSLGNYATIMFAWCISTTIGSRRTRGIILALSLLCIVLADGRFAGGCCALMALTRLLPLERSRLFVFLVPVVIMTALTLLGATDELQGTVPAIMSDDFHGRLLFSGRLLDYWNFPQWFGLLPSQVYTADTGYAYVVNNLGLPMALLLLALFALHPAVRPEAGRMKMLVTIYIATSLCIGASIFTIKTAALLWFLYGVANRPAALIWSGIGVPARERARSLATVFQTAR